MSFATGFFNASSDILDENQRYIKEKRAKDRDFLMTYGVQAVTKAQEKVNNAVTVAMQLESYGVDKEDINYIVDTSGPLGLKAVYDEVKPIYDEGRLTSDTLSSMIKRTQEYKPSNMTYEDMIKKTFGLYKANATDDPAENEKIGFWSALGFDSRAADSALNEQYIDGFTGRDIKRIMGTASPGLKAPVPVDFSLLPKIHSDTTLRSFAISNLTRMEDDAEAFVSAMAPTDAAYAALSDDDKTKHDTIKAAIKAKRYDLLLKYVPTIQSHLLDFDKETRGGLSQNPHFNTVRGMEPFFTNTAAKVEGSTATTSTAKTDELIQPPSSSVENAAYKTDLAKIHSMYPNLVDTIKLADIKTYETKEEATKSGDPVYILNGQLLGRSSLLKGLNSGASTEKKVAAATGVGAPFLNIDVPDSDGNFATRSGLFSTGDYTNPVVNAWDTLVQDALSEFRYDGKTKDQINRYDRKGYRTARKPLEDLLESVTDYLIADAEGAPDDERLALAEELGAKINEAPEELQVTIANLLNKFQGIKSEDLKSATSVVPAASTTEIETAISDEAPSAIDAAPFFPRPGQPISDSNAPEFTDENPVQRVAKPLATDSEGESQFRDGIDNVNVVEEFNPIGEAYRNPDEVIANGYMPFTELVETSMIPKDAIELTSFDTLKARLKDGTIKEGDVITGLRGKAFLVDHSGVGAVDKIKFSNESISSPSTESASLMSPTTDTNETSFTDEEAMTMYREMLQRKPAQGVGRLPQYARPEDRRDPVSRALYIDIFLEALKTRPSFETRGDAILWIEDNFPEADFTLEEKGRASGTLFGRFGS